MVLAALVEETKNKLRLQLPRASDNKQQKNYSIVKGKWEGEEKELLSS